MQFITVTILLAFFASTLALPQGSASDLQPAESMLEEPAISEAVVNGATSELSARSGIKTVVAQTCNGENFAYGCRNWLANGGSTSCTNTGTGGQQDSISSIRTFGSTCTFWVYVLLSILRNAILTFLKVMQTARVTLSSSFVEQPGLRNCHSATVSHHSLAGLATKLYNTFRLGLGIAISSSLLSSGPGILSAG
jgi:hypothetical protein